MNLSKINPLIVVILFILCPLVQSLNDDRKHISPFKTSDEELQQSSNRSDSVNQLLKLTLLKSNGSGFITYKTHLDNGFHLKDNIRQNWDGVNWINNWIYSYTYDAKDNITELSFQRWDGSNWVGYFMIVNTYDENDNKTKWIYQNWNGSNWVSNSMATSAYDEHKNMIEEVIQLWDGSNWIPQSRHTYSWENKNMTEDLREMWNGNNWVLAQKNTYTWDGENMIEDLSQLWSDSWIDERKNTYKYDEYGNRIEALYQVWYISYWANKSRNLYKYDGKNMIEDLSQNPDAADWVNESRKTYAFDGNNDLIEYFIEEWSSSVWVNISRNLYSYDGKHNAIEDLLQDWNNSDWVNVRMHSYTYDQYNNKTEDLSQNWNGSNWANIERDIYNYSSAPQITRPKKGGLLISGQKDTVRWVGGIENTFIKLKYSTDGGINFELIDSVISASDSMYIWDIPGEIFSTKSLIRIERDEYFEILAESDTFRIKPLIITKLKNGDYISYDSTDWWGFSNTPSDLWPQSWWQKIDYTGIDPITKMIYPWWQGDSVFAKANPSDHPDWMSFVGAFGVTSCYFDTYRGIYRPKALLSWKAKKGDWNGSCFGIAISNALAFEKKDKFLTAYPDFPDINTPNLVHSDTNVVKIINELFTHQFGNPHEANLDLFLQKTPNETLNELRDLLKEDKVKIKTLSFISNDSNDVGGHAVLGYKIEKDTSFDHIYYIYVYDNSYPNVSDAKITIDTLANDGRGAWSTQYAWQNWGGDSYLFLEDTAITFLEKPALPKKANIKSPFSMSNNELQIFTSTQSTPLISDDQGNQTGISSTGMVVEIPGSYPLIKRNGNSELPYGYHLPIDNYSIVLNNFSAETVNAFLFTGNKSFEYERFGAAAAQVDKLYFNGGLSVINPDAEMKSIKLLNIIDNQSEQKVFVIRSFELAQNDSVEIENPDDNTLKLVSYGSSKHYQIELNHASELGVKRFVKSNISLPLNTTHKIVPVWTDITKNKLTILVDRGNNESVDDTLYLKNEVTGISKDKGRLIPTEYKLEQNYPNPFNNSTVIKYSIPKEGLVILKIYNAIGEEVATLLNEIKQLGIYEATFNTGDLASGIYFYQLKSGNFVETKKMILLK